MSAKHTPGPWTAARSDTGQVVRTPEGVQIADCRKMWEFRLAEDEALANARLIAAAPDLLNAARLAAEAIRTLSKDQAHKYAIKDVLTEMTLKTVELAIAKATPPA